MSLNPYSPPTESNSAGVQAVPLTSVVRQLGVFVLGFVLAIHLYSISHDGFQLHNMLLEYSGDRWLWNLVVRLPYLALIQFALLIGYARVRKGHEQTYPGTTVIRTFLLGLFTGFFREQAYDLIRIIPEDMFGLAIDWTPHYIIIWIAYAVTTVVTVETLSLLQRHVLLQPTDTDEP